MIQVVRRSIVDVYNRYSFNRQSLTYDSKGRLYHLHNARFEPGKFGKAIMVEEGTTNLLPTNISNVETDKTGFHTRNGSVISRDTTQHWEGNASLKVVTSSSQATSGFYTDSISASPETAYTASIWLKGNVGGEVVRFVVYENANKVMDISCTLTTEWQRFTGVATTLSTSTSLRPFVWNQAASEITFYADGLQIEKKSYPTTFVNGTRAAETLTIPTAGTAGVLNPQEGTVECWVKAQDIYSRRRDIFTVNKPVASEDHVILGYNVTGTGLELHWRPANATAYAIRATNLGATTDWVYVGFRYKWNGTGYDLALLYNGQVVATGTATNGQMTNFYQALLGCSAQPEGGFTYYANMLFDDLRISNIARSDEEILAAYESNQPLPVDQYTTCKLSFDGPDGQRGTTIVTL